MNVPAHLEADLLALIEDQPLDAAREAAVRSAVAADPALQRLVASMRQDRALVASLGACSAPADLLERVESVLEREALLGAASLEASAPASIPISRVQVQRPTIRTLMMRHRWVGPLAMAACLAIVAGASLMIFRSGRTPSSAGTTIASAGSDRRERASELAMSGSSGVPNSAPGSIAREAAAPTEPSGVIASAGMVETGAAVSESLKKLDESGAPSDPKMALAAAAEEQDGPGGGMASRSVGFDRALSQNIARNNDPLSQIEDATAGDRDDRARAAGARGYPVLGREVSADDKDRELGDKRVLAKASPTISTEEAAALLKEGRLAVRLLAPTVEQGEKALRGAHRQYDQISEPTSLEPVHLGAALAVVNPVRDQAALQPEAAPAAPPSPPVNAAANPAEGERSDAERFGAPPTRGAQPPPGAPVKSAPPSVEPPAPPPAPAGYAVLLPADAAAIERLMSSLSGPGQRVEFIELPVIDVKEKKQAEWRDAAGVVAPLDPAAIIWWTSPVRLWAVRAKLPVVVQPTP